MQLRRCNTLFATISEYFFIKYSVNLSFCNAYLFHWNFNVYKQ